MCSTWNSTLLAYDEHTRMRAVFDCTDPRRSLQHVLVKYLDSRVVDEALIVRNGKRMVRARADRSDEPPGRGDAPSTERRRGLGRHERHVGGAYTLDTAWEAAPLRRGLVRGFFCGTLEFFLLLGESIPFDCLHSVTARSMVESNLSRKSALASPNRSFAPFHVTPLSKFMPKLQRQRSAPEGSVRTRRTSSQFSLRSLQRGIRKLARLAQVVHGAETVHRFHCAEGSQTVAEVLRGNGRCEPGDVYSFGDNFVHVDNVGQARRRLCFRQGREDERQLSKVTAERVRRSG